MIGFGKHPTVPGIGVALGFIVCLCGFVGFILDIGIQLHIYIAMNDNIYYIC